MSDAIASEDVPTPELVVLGGQRLYGSGDLASVEHVSKTLFGTGWIGTPTEMATLLTSTYYMIPKESST